MVTLAYLQHHHSCTIHHMSHLCHMYESRFNLQDASVNVYNISSEDFPVFPSFKFLPTMHIRSKCVSYGVLSSYSPRLGLVLK
jgi:hypothetical protein